MGGVNVSLPLLSNEQILQTAQGHLKTASYSLGELAKRSDTFKEYWYNVNKVLRALEDKVWQNNANAYY